MVAPATYSLQLAQNTKAPLVRDCGITSNDRETVRKSDIFRAVGDHKRIKCNINFDIVAIVVNKL